MRTFEADGRILRRQRKFPGKTGAGSGPGRLKKESIGSISIKKDNFRKIRKSKRLLTISTTVKKTVKIVDKLKLACENARIQTLENVIVY